jgi:hypothetical protein
MNDTCTDQRRCSPEEMAHRFPHFVAPEDSADVAILCRAELEAWRRAVSRHYAVSDIGTRLATFGTKARAFESLRVAYHQMAAQSAAA